MRIKRRGLITAASWRGRHQSSQIINVFSNGRPFFGVADDISLFRRVKFSERFCCDWLGGGRNWITVCLPFKRRTPFFVCSCCHRFYIQFASLRFIVDSPIIWTPCVNNNGPSVEKTGENFELSGILGFKLKCK